MVTIVVTEMENYKGHPIPVESLIIEEGMVKYCRLIVSPAIIACLPLDFPISELFCEAVMN